MSCSSAASCVGSVRRIDRGGDLVGRRGPGQPLARPVRATLDVDASHDGEAAHHDPGRARDDGDVTQLQVAPAHERETPQLHVEPLGHDDVDPAPEGHGGDLDFGTLDLGPAQVHVASAHDGHGVRLPADAPATLGAVAAHDRDVPAPLLLGRGAALGQGLGRRSRLGQVRHDGHQIAPGPRLERGADPFGELVEREPALDHVLPQLGHGPIPIGVGHPLGQGPGTPGRRGRAAQEGAGPP